MAGKPASRDLTIYAGAKFAKRFIYSTKDPVTGVVTPVDMTAFSGGRLVAKINPTDTAIIYEFSTVNGSMVLGAVAGSIDLLKTPTQNAAPAPLNFDSAGYVLYLIDIAAAPLPPILIGNLNVDYSTLPSGG